MKNALLSARDNRNTNIVWRAVRPNFYFAELGKVLICVVFWRFHGDVKWIVISTRLQEHNAVSECRRTNIVNHSAIINIGGKATSKDTTCNAVMSCTVVSHLIGAPIKWEFPKISQKAPIKWELQLSERSADRWKKFQLSDFFRAPSARNFTI